ncbi:MAG: IS3 family transposase, partial [Proteobacteria bacterium]
VRDITHQWMIAYNEERPHEALGNLPPRTYRIQQQNQTQAA